MSFFNGGLAIGMLIPAVFPAPVGTVRFVQGLGLLPFVALARNRAKKNSGGGGEERGPFHPAADVADRPRMASPDSRGSGAVFSG